MTGITKYRPTASMVVAMIALFAAFGGGAFAAQKAAKNSVVSKSIKNSQVKTLDIKDAGVTSADILDGDVQSDDLAGSSVTQAKLADGSVIGQKLSADSVDSPRVVDGSLTNQDLAPAARSSVVASGKVFNPDGGGAPALHFPNNLDSVAQAGGNGEGTTKINVDPSVIPGGAAQLPRCSIQATLTTDGAPNASLAYPGLINVATGGGLQNGQIQVQTRKADAGLGDISYYIQVTCPQV